MIAVHDTAPESVSNVHIHAGNAFGCRRRYDAV